jgi:hypothetical protein
MQYKSSLPSLDKIRDILHLYLGAKCNVEGIGKYGWYRLSPAILTSVENGEITVKPILRQLSSMTEEEAKDFCEMEGWGRDLENIVVTDGAIDFKRVVGSRTETCITRFTRCRPEMFRWLLSKHFDLFNLIPEGLAIDADTLKTTSNG